jgi:hypothetical protein
MEVIVKVQLRCGITVSRLVVLGMLAVLFLPGRLAAQIDTGGITGTVQDSSGAVIAGVQITLRNEATGVKTTAESTSTGTYVFDAVMAGNYTIEATAKGFQTNVGGGLIVHVQQVLTVDLSLVPGVVTQQVTVRASAPMLQAENAALGQTVSSTMVNDLPLNGRNWVSLAQLSSGAATAPVNSPSTNSGQTGSAYFSVDGSNVWQNDIRLNGINDNIEIYGGSNISTNATITPPPDALQEFKLQSGDFNAEFGHSTGAIVNAVTKSGTNHLHGDVWEFVRNNDIQANDYFSNLAGRATAPYHQNQFGATLGGPVSFPGYDGRNKTFFFLAYQGLRNVQALSIFSPSLSLLSTVPTAAMQQSSFTNMQSLITDLSGSPTTDALGRSFPLGTIMDPATTRAVPGNSLDPVSGLPNTSSSTVYVRDPFYNGGSIAGITNFTTAAAESNLNMLPGTRLNTNAQKMLALYPTPNQPGFLNDFFYNPELTNSENQGDLRLDQNFSANDSLFFAADYSRIVFSIPSVLPGLAVGQKYGQAQSYPAYAIAVGFNHVFAPTLINEFHFGFDHFIENITSIYGNTPGLPAEFGIEGIPSVPNNGGLPPTTITGIHNMGVGNYTPTLETIYALEFMDNVTKVHANHTFKAGIQLDSLEGDIIQPPSSRGNFTYSGQYSDVVNKARGYNGMADLLLTPIAATVPGGINNVGGVSAYNGSNYAPTDDHRWYLGIYGQDDWKLTRRLTLNLGLRWDYFTPYAEVNGRQANTVLAGGNGSTGIYYVPNKGCTVARASAFNTLLQSSGIMLDCVPSLAVGQAQTSNFAPRLGFAYRVMPNLVVRGGYGIAYGALGNIGYGGTLGLNYPFIYNIANLSTNNSYTPLTLAGGATATEFNTFNSINLTDPTQITGVGVSLYGRQYNYQTPYIQQMNLTVQDQFTPHDSASIAYVGTLGRHLDNYYNTLNSASEILPPGTNVANYLPLPNFAANTTYETTNATSAYNSMQLNYEHQFARGLSLLGNYTWSKCMSDQRTQAKATPNYRAPWLAGFGIQGDYSLCDIDATNIFHLSGLYDLPVGRGRTYASHMSRAADAVLGGWSVNFIYTFQSGQPFTVACPTATAVTADFGCDALTVPGQNIYGGPHDQLQWLNPAAFVTPAPATAIGQSSIEPLGGLPGQARGPWFSNLDSSIFKNFHFTETRYLQFRAEAFNTSNSAQFGQPSQLNYTTTSTTAPFGEITSLRNSPRLFQLALKLYF